MKKNEQNETAMLNVTTAAKQEKKYGDENSENPKKRKKIEKYCQENNVDKSGSKKKKMKKSERQGLIMAVNRIHKSSTDRTNGFPRRRSSGRR